MRDEAQLEAARVTLERYRTLLQQDSIARQDVDTQAALVKQLEGTVVADKANEGTARLNLGYTRVVAPIGGRVGLRTVDVGNVVSTSDANGVAVITQLSPIDVEFAVPQDQAPELQRNAGAFMEAKALDRTRTDVLDVGVFASLDNQVDHPDRDGARQGPLQQRQAGSVPQPVRQRAAQCAHHPRRRGGSGVGAAPGQHRRVCVRAQGGPHRGAAAGTARPGDGRQGPDRQRTAGWVSA